MVESDLSTAELAEFEKYYEEMWTLHCETCARLGEGFMTQTREQFRVNMLGFWDLNKQAEEARIKETKTKPWKVGALRNKR